MMENIEVEVEVEVGGIESKFTRIALTIVSVFLIFVGPTYVPYLLSDVLKLNYYTSIGIGLVLFIVGLVLLIFLIRKKAIT
jgi:hypothetical protein